MTNDAYLRTVLTVIAAALLYLCIIFTPLPTAFAQGGRVVGAPTPGVSTGPGEMVIVGWRVPEAIPVQVARGDVRVTNDELRVTGRVQTEPLATAITRTSIVGWEQGGGADTRGTFRTFRDAGATNATGLPVVITPPKP